MIVDVLIGFAIVVLAGWTGANWGFLLKLERRLERMTWLADNPQHQAKKHPAARWPPSPNSPDLQDWNNFGPGRGWDATADEADERSAPETGGRKGH